MLSIYHLCRCGSNWDNYNRMNIPRPITYKIVHTQSDLLSAAAYARIVNQQYV